MPSNARKAFDEHVKDVRRLIEIHEEEAGDQAGRKWGVEVLNKSAIVLITAFWEAYCEDLAAEALEHLVEHSTPDTLPKKLRKQIAAELKEDKNELAIWQLSQDGWKKVLSGRLTELKKKRNFDWNTPKAARVEALFEETLGISDVSAAWTWQAMSAQSAGKKLDKYVSLRGDIAHRGAAQAYVTKPDVRKYLAHVKRLAAKTGMRVNKEIKKATGETLF